MSVEAIRRLLLLAECEETATRGGGWRRRRRRGSAMCRVVAEYHADARALRLGAAALRVLPTMLEALERSQFAFGGRRCPVCAGWGMSDRGETDGVHTKVCPVGLAIAAAKEIK